ncbi:MAG TPA: 50S ribosomal protein L21 [Nevskiaceae bacterium]|nr:50S ribosomal protein L21 [Nevskiaceae bacterium]
MSKFTVIKIGSSQYKVAEGDEIDVDKIEGKKGSKLTFNQVLLLIDGEKVSVGQPLVKGVQIEAKILEQFKGKKIRVATYKAKSRYRRVKGFRPLLTKIKIEKITASRTKIQKSP